MTNINIRIDDDVKQEAEALLTKMGITISGAINMFFRQIIKEQALPFQPKAVTESQMQARQELKEVLRAMQVESVKNGTDKMTLEEINGIIAECREEMREEE